MDFVDLFKWLVIGNGVVLAVQALRVVSVYSSVYSLSPKDWRKQLPLHVWLMALSFFIYVATSSVYLAIRQDQELVRVLAYGLAGAIAQYGLWNVLKYDRRRYSKVTNFQDPYIEP